MTIILHLRWLMITTVLLSLLQDGDRNGVWGFAPSLIPSSSVKSNNRNNNVFRCNQKKKDNTIQLYARISKDRRQELGIGDDEDEYDLDKALDVNTDPLITKIIAGSLIVTIVGLLVVGIIIPYTTEYDEGICNVLLNGGRC